MKIDDGKQRRSVTIKDEDKEVLNEFLLPTDTRQVTTTVEGQGSVLVSLNYEYYVEEPPKEPAFKLDLKVEMEASSARFCSTLHMHLMNLMTSL